MKINRSIRFEESIDSTVFDKPFFNRFERYTYNLKLEKGRSKNYVFPTMFENGSVTQGMFLCSYKKACELMPNQHIKPVRMTRSKALIVISCYQYRDISQMEPYNEIAMVIPTLNESRLRVPFLPLLGPGLFKKFGFYVFNMPLTSYENLLRGPIWGFPKVLKEIEFRKENGQSVCEIKNEDGSKYLTLRVPAQGKSEVIHASSNVFTLKKGKVVKSVTRFTGNFQVTKNLKRLFPTKKEAGSFIEIGKSDDALLLKNMEIDPIPFQTRYCENLSSSIDIPNYMLANKKKGVEHV